MIEENTIKFGYGDIVVTSDVLCGTITFNYVKPAYEVGDKVNMTTSKDMVVVSKITLIEDKPFEFSKLIKNVTVENTLVQYKGYVFDFSRYNEKSVEIVRRHAENMVCLLALGC